MIFTSGMLSKFKNQVLRVAAVMHVLFHMDSREISEEAVKAAVLWTSVFNMLHTQGGRGDFQEAVDDIQQGLYTYCLI